MNYEVSFDYRRIYCLGTIRNGKYNSGAVVVFRCSENRQNRYRLSA